MFRIRVVFNADPDPAFWVNADPDADSDRIQIQGLDDQKFKNLQPKKEIFFDQKLQFTSS
jgi:hypothetical protein